MYSVNINFLNDRKQINPGSNPNTPPNSRKCQPNYLFYTGAAAGLVAVVISFVAYKNLANPGPGPDQLTTNTVPNTDSENSFSPSEPAADAPSLFINEREPIVFLEEVFNIPLDGESTYLPVIINGFLILGESSVRSQLRRNTPVRIFNILEKKEYIVENLPFSPRRIDGVGPKIVISGSDNLGEIPVAIWHNGQFLQVDGLLQHPDGSERWAKLYHFMDVKDIPWASGNSEVVVALYKDGTFTIKDLSGNQLIRFSIEESIKTDTQFLQTLLNDIDKSRLNPDDSYRISSTMNSDGSVQISIALNAHILSIQIGPDGAYHVSAATYVKDNFTGGFSQVYTFERNTLDDPRFDVVLALEKPGNDGSVVFRPYLVVPQYGGITELRTPNNLGFILGGFTSGSQLLDPQVRFDDQSKMFTLTFTQLSQDSQGNYFLEEIEVKIPNYLDSNLPPEQQEIEFVTPRILSLNPNEQLIGATQVYENGASRGAVVILNTDTETLTIRLAE